MKPRSKLPRRSQRYIGVLLVLQLAAAGILLWLWAAVPADDANTGGPARVKRTPPSPISTCMAAHVDTAWGKVRDEVKAEARASWNCYKNCAFGWDEVRPVACKGLVWAKPPPDGQPEEGSAEHKGIALTLIDALDTLHLMGLHSDFQEAVQYLERNHTFNTPGSVSVFEVTIRILGGLLSAYQLSNETVLLAKAVDLADRLFPGVGSQGLPRKYVDLSNAAREGDAPRPGARGQAPCLAEAGSVSLELLALAELSGQGRFARYARALSGQLYAAEPEDSLWSSALDIEPKTRALWGLAKGKGKATVGGRVDSFLEYTAKLYLRTGEPAHLGVFSRAVSSIERRLVVRVGGRTFLRELHLESSAAGGRAVNRSDHLSCFLPGVYALMLLNCGPACAGPLREVMNRTAVELAETCFLMYSVGSPHLGLAPNAVLFDEKGEIRVGKFDRFNILRPEAVEAWYWLWRWTGDVKYRRWTRCVFESFRTFAKQKTTGGYFGIRDTTKETVKSDIADKMHSFWLAETLKYMWMTFSEPSDILNDGFVRRAPEQPLWVFNTEAHPLSQRRNPSPL
ncbi:Mannosyl-oligosaccharide 1 [Diplonema papillatum]|nr:Mannosyl-oligosaccharide 1 [Diplonema papillatum]